MHKAFLKGSSHGGQVTAEYVVILVGLMASLILMNFAFQRNIMTSFSEAFTDMFMIMTTLIKLPI